MRKKLPISLLSNTILILHQIELVRLVLSPGRRTRPRGQQMGPRRKLWGNNLYSCCLCYAAGSIPSVFEDFEHCDVIRVHLVFHLCGFTCLVHGTDVSGPNPCCSLHRQKMLQTSGSRQGFTRWCHLALGIDFFTSRAGHTLYCLRFCNLLYPLVGGWPSQLHQGPR